MCATCGCGSEEVRFTSMGTSDAAVAAHDHPHDHPHDHAHDHDHDAHTHGGGLGDGLGDGLGGGRHTAGGLRTHTVELEQRVLAKNDLLAADNRRWLADRGLRAVNLMSSPGAGKTTLLERTIGELGQTVTVIEGDQETVFDAERIRAAGARAVQVNTGSGCHLDASMVQQALRRLDPEDGGLVFVENVGNLVCPALFDLGESRKVVVISVTEGDDKPLKYPHMFAAADLVVVNKTDLLPHVDFDVGRLATDARRLNPQLEVLALSARTGDRFSRWLDWLHAL